jgi:hypothetical protein
MTCDICGRGACANSFHSLAEQERYADVIAAFDRAREMRADLRDELAEEEREAQAAHDRELARELAEADEEDASLWGDDLHGASG